MSLPRPQAADPKIGVAIVLHPNAAAQNAAKHGRCEVSAAKAAVGIRGNIVAEVIRAAARKVSKPRNHRQWVREADGVMLTQHIPS